MSPKKLTESDKQEILQLYRHSGETTSTLAIRYEVSSSTISRFLKTNLSEDEYEDLIQQKRLSRTPQRPDTEETSENIEATQLELVTDSHPTATDLPTMTSIFSPPSLSEKREEILAETIYTPISPKGIIKKRSESLTTEVEVKPNQGNTTLFQDLFDEDLTDLDEDIEDAEVEDWDDDEEDEEEEDQELVTAPRRGVPHAASVQVLPLSQALFPKMCYLVIDRGAELITRPLKEFSDLGTIPATEVQQQTLPVFDNHRVAKRFSNRSQRVIKIPDGRMLLKTSPYLEAKGITRLLMDGQIYSLVSN